MFSSFRRASEALTAIAQGLQALCKLIQQNLELRHAHGDVEERLSELERARATWEAEIEAQLMRAESTFKQARAAEERTRHAAKKISSQIDEESEEDLPEPYRRLLEGGHGNGGASGGVHPVRENLESSVTYPPSRGDQIQALRAIKLGSR